MLSVSAAARVQVKKQGRKRKEAVVDTILECLENYSHVYVFSMDGMRTSVVKDLRQKFAEDRFVMGKQTVMALAVGRNAEEEPRDNLHKLSEHLTGTAGLLFSNRKQKEVVSFFKTFCEPEFATGGTVASADYIIPQGPVAFQHTMADPLRKLGLPVMLRNGTLMCEKDHQVRNSTRRPRLSQPARRRALPRAAPRWLERQSGAARTRSRMRRGTPAGQATRVRARASHPALPRPH